MAMHDINTICSQILTSDDLTVEESVFQEVSKNKVVTKILNNKNNRYIKIFSKEQLFLSHITPILHDIGFEIVDEVSFNLTNKKDTIYISRFNLNSLDLEKIEIAKTKAKKGPDKGSSFL